MYAVINVLSVDTNKKPNVFLISGPFKNYGHAQANLNSF